MNVERRGGRREGSGRKRKGITKKVSLTISKDLWNEIEEFDGTVSDYIRALKAAEFKKKNIELKEVTNSKTPEPETTKDDVDYFWSIYKEDFLLENEVSAEATNNAYGSLIHLLFQGKETIQLETSPRYRSQYTGKWFSSIKNMLKAEIPKLIASAEKDVQKREKLAQVDREV